MAPVLVTGGTGFVGANCLIRLLEAGHETRARSVTWRAKATCAPCCVREESSMVADVSGPNDIAEISIAAALAVGIPSSPRTGGIDRGVQFELWPGTPAFVSGDLSIKQE